MSDKQEDMRPQTMPDEKAPQAESEADVSGAENSGANMPHKEEPKKESSEEETSAEEKHPEPDAQKKEAVPVMCARAFHGLATAAPLVLFIALALMVWPDFWRPADALYCPAESKYISAFLHAVTQNSWLTPTALDNGQWIVPQWPVFYWFIALLAAVPHVAELGLLLPLAGAITAFLAILGVWCLCIAAGFGIRAAFAAGIMLLCCPLFAPLPHFFGPVALACALMTFGFACFVRGWNAHRSWLLLPCAFILTALAGMCGGLLYFAAPILASILYLVWRGKLRRAQAWDAMAGFILMLAVGGGWLLMIIFEGGSGNYLTELFSADATFDLALRSGWWLAPAIALAGLLPWLLEIFGVSWVRVFATAPKTLGASRRENGSAMVWIAVVVTTCLGVFVTREQVAAVAIVCLAAPLLGKAFMMLPPFGNRLLFLLTSLCLIIVGILLLCCGFQMSQNWVWSITGLHPGQTIENLLLTGSGLPIVGGICLAGGILLLVLTRKYRDGGPLVFCMVLTIIICQPVLLTLVPDFASRPEARLETGSSIEKRVMAAIGTPNVAAQPVETAPAVPLTPPVETKQQPEAAPTAPEAVAPEPSQADSATGVETPAPVAPAVPESDSTSPEGAPAETANPDAADANKSRDVHEEMIIIEEHDEARKEPQADESGSTSANP